jgi:ADP-ribose pyrophosphatase YjhB (NUDIX family)
MKYAKIGCEAWITRDDKVLLLKRGNGEHAGTWSLPGGHLEFLERMDLGIIRELKEELDIDVVTENVQPIAITDDLRKERGEHYVHITFKVDIGEQAPKCNEPDKCSEIKWFPVDNLPKNIFPFQAKIFDTLKAKRVYVNLPSQ